MIETENSLANLGPARTSATEQRIYLARIANEYERRVTDCLDAKLHEVVPIDSPLKIRTHIQNMNEQFAVKMQSDGHTRSFKNIEDEDFEATRGQELYEISADANSPRKPKDDIYEWIKTTYRNSRGPELPGLVNPHVVIEMFREQSTQWKPLAQAHVSAVVDVVSRFNAAVFSRVVPDETVRNKLQTKLSRDTSAAITTAYRQLDQLIDDECKGILQTVNDSFTQTHRAMRHQRTIAQFTRKKDENNMINFTAIVQMLTMSNEDSTVHDIHDILKSYYEISLKRFTDNVILQVIERHLLGDGGPIRLLKAEYISSLEDGALASIASEDYQVSSFRKELKIKLERAREAQEAANMISV